MRNLLSAIGRFLTELRRRKVYQVALAYVVVGFMVIEAADLTLVRLGLPPWTVTLVIVLVGLGFPIALVLTWALEVTPEGVRVEEATAKETEEAEEIPAAKSTTRDLWVGASVLVLLLLGAWWMWGGFSGDQDAGGVSTGGPPEIEERTIAVLPFEVSGAGAEEWRDGMVTTLSLNLDGAAGMRAIADRTVFAAWNETGETEKGISTEEALAVARKVGARYAIIGSAVQLAEDLRFAAEVYRTGSGERLGQVDVRGAPGSVTTLTNELTREVLGVLLDRSEEAIPSVDLESITTSSLPALKAYLEGERRFRTGEYEEAAENFRAAIQQDSTFALAYARLSWSYAWTGSDARPAARQAYVLSDRLPRRERRIVRARYLGLNEGRRIASADTLRQLSRAYPDDPTVWYHLGEVIYHSNIPRGLPAAEEAFRRAVELDPGLAPYHHHLVDLAFALHRDSALVTKRIAAHPAEGARTRFHRFALRLVFGGDEKRKRTLAELDTLSIPDTWLVNTIFRHPRDLGLQEKVLRRVLQRDDIVKDPYVQFLLENDFKRGRTGQLLEDMKDWEMAPDRTAGLFALAVCRGMAVPDTVAGRILAPENLPPDPSADRLLQSGLYLVEQGRQDEAGEIASRIRELDTADSSEARRKARELEGYRAFRAGNLKEAERQWNGSNRTGPMGAIWRGDLYRELGQRQTAEDWYLAAWIHPVAHERLGQLYETMDRPEKAAAAYERFIAAWAEADPELQDRVEAAQQRLGALRDETDVE